MSAFENFFEKLKALFQSPPQTQQNTTPAPAPTNNWLVGVQGQAQGKNYNVRTSTMTLGRDPSNTIQLIEEHVSRKHIYMKGEPSGVKVTNLSKRNPVWVGNEPLAFQETALLTHEQRLKVGKNIFVLYQKNMQVTNNTYTDAKIGHGHAQETSSVGLD